MHPALLHTAHRPWPVPDRPWRVALRRHNLLFAHWPLAPDALRGRVPRELELDTFGGEAWIGVIPFAMTGVRLRGLPPLPGAARLLALDVRTYVRAGDRPGVYRFSLDVGAPLAAAAARLWYGLPCYRARMRLRDDGITVHYRCHRAHRGAPEAYFVGSYEPTGAPAPAQPETLAHWLVERYCLYTVRRGRVYRTELHHAPWPLQPAQAAIEFNSMALAAGIDLPDVYPQLHFTREVDILAWGPSPAARGAALSAGR